MRFIINYIRSCFCKHNFEFIREINTYENASSTAPYKTTQYYRCKKCGYVQKIKME